MSAEELLRIELTGDEQQFIAELWELRKRIDAAPIRRLTGRPGKFKICATSKLSGRHATSKFSVHVCKDRKLLSTHEATGEHAALAIASLACRQHGIPGYSWIRAGDANWLKFVSINSNIVLIERAK